MKHLCTLTIAGIMLASCLAPKTQPTPIPTPSQEVRLGFTEEQIATLSSLELVDDHPLYSMRYVGSYDGPANVGEAPQASTMLARSAQDRCQLAWGCSLFAALGDKNNRLLGRNFDWQSSPALLLFTAPADGYASVSMVDIEYLGFKGDRSRTLMDLSLDDRRPLLEAPSLPFDGMNEKGLAVAMAAVPAESMPYDPQKPTIDHLEVIREILDHAATVEDAIGIFGNYNIDMGNVPLHYLIASALGDAVLVEFYEGEMVVFPNQSSWQTATNFLVASANGRPQGQCWRYDRISQHLLEVEGWMSSDDALLLLGEVSQGNTQWSIVYQLTTGEVSIVMGRDYSGVIHTFDIGKLAG